MRLYLAGACIVLLVLLSVGQSYALDLLNGWTAPTGSNDYGGYLGWLGYVSGTGYHLAQDMQNGQGSPVYAIGDGEVIMSRTDVGGYGPGWTKGGALVARFQAGDGTWFTALYGHLNSPHGTGGVSAGDVLGYSNAWSPPHLHFGIHPGYDPEPNNPWRGYTTDSSNTYGFTNPIDFLNAHSRGTPPILQGVDCWCNLDQPSPGSTRLHDDAVSGWVFDHNYGATVTRVAFLLQPAGGSWTWIGDLGHNQPRSDAPGGNNMCGFSGEWNTRFWAGQTITVKALAFFSDGSTSDGKAQMVNSGVYIPPIADLTPPTSVGISPGSPSLTDDLTAVVSGGGDPEGEPFSYQIQWSSDGGTTWGNDGVTLPHSLTTPGQTWLARARTCGTLSSPWTSPVNRYSYWVQSPPVTVGTPPKVVNATYVDSTHVNVLFDEAMDSATTTIIGNYAVAPSLTVTAAVLDADTKTVHLTTATQAWKTAYQVTVSNVTGGGVLVDATHNTATWTTPNPPPPTFVNAHCVNATHVNVVFSMAVGPVTSQTATNYKISPTCGVTAAVLDTHTKTVHLTTASQTEGTTYTVTVSGVKSVAGTPIVTGSGDKASWAANFPPTVQNVTCVDDTHVDVLFSKTVGPVTSQTAANYKVSPALKVIAAVRDADLKTVHLTTGPQVDATLYTLTVSGVKTETHVPILKGSGDSWSWTANFPTLKSVAFVDLTHVDLSFSRSVGTSLTYSISPTLAVTAAERDPITTTMMHLTTAAQTDLTTYTVTVGGSGAGKKSWTVDLPPTIVSATYVNATHVDVLFSKAVGPVTSQTATNYKVAPALAVTVAVRDADLKTVHLTTSTQVNATKYKVTASGVKSVAGTPIVKGSGDSASWTAGAPGAPGLASVAVTVAAAPTSVGAQIMVNLTAAAEVTVTIRNLAGREIAVLTPGPLEAGVHSLLWNGKSSAGTKVPAGTYLVQVSAKSSGGANCTALSPLQMR